MSRSCLKTEQPAAQMIAEKMRQAVMDLNINNPSSPYGIITISLGLACQKPSSNSHPDNLIKAADEMLYLGKQKGRNAVSG